MPLPSYLEANSAGESTGLLTIQGPNTIFNTNLVQPRNPGSELVVENGATFINGQVLDVIFDSRATLKDPGTTVMNFGAAGGPVSGIRALFGGKIFVVDGASLWSAGLVPITGEGSVEGLITVDNAFFCAESQIQLGGFSDGISRLSVNNGGQVLNSVDPELSSRSGIVGTSEGAIGIVEINGQFSEWVQENQLIVGNNGIGIVSVSGGGYLQCHSSILARFANSQGDCIVTGGEWLVEDSIYIGGDPIDGVGGNAQISVGGLGRVTVGTKVKLFEAGTIFVAEDPMMLGSDGGEFIIGTPASPIECGSVQIGVGGELAGNGTINANIFNDGAKCRPDVLPAR